jgi:hypothetical protein
MFASFIDHPTLATLLGYWQTKRGAAALPARRDIDPLEMGSGLLPHLVLCDLFERGTRVRFRLVGTEVVKRLGVDPTGKFLDDAATGDYRDVLAALHRLVYCERAPVFAESRFSWGAGRRLEAQHLLLPLTQGGADPAIALAGFVFRASEPFAPTIRALAGKAEHEELRRLIAKPIETHDWDEGPGRIVA